MQSKIETLKKYLQSLPEEDKDIALSALTKRDFDRLQSIIKSSLVHIKRKMRTLETQYKEIMMSQVLLDDYCNQLI